MHRLKLCLTVLLLALPGAVNATEVAPLRQLPDITILSTMTSNYMGSGEWGFSALLEFEDEAILFDTGFKAITVRDNAKYLGKDLSRVQRVILTHFHTDHTGGLLTLRRTFMDKNPAAFSTVYVGKGFFEARYLKDGTPTYSLSNPGFTESFQTPDAFRKAAESIGIKFVVVSEATLLRRGALLTGPIKRIHDEKNVSPGFFLEENGHLEADTVPESQVLGLRTAEGWVLISGCGHSGIINAASSLRAKDHSAVHSAIGGFHLFRASDEVIDWTAEKLKEFGTERLIGAHCTGIQATQRLADILGLPRTATSTGAVGTRIDSKLNIIPASIE